MEAVSGFKRINLKIGCHLFDSLFLNLFSLEQPGSLGQVIGNSFAFESLNRNNGIMGYGLISILFASIFQYSNPPKNQRTSIPTFQPRALRHSSHLYGVKPKSGPLAWIFCRFILAQCNNHAKTTNYL
jgi:hypothetical protein